MYVYPTLPISAEKTIFTRNMTLKYFFLTLLLATVMVGCESNGIASSKMYLKEIINAPYYKNEFEYQDGRLVLFKRHFGDQLGRISKFTYRNDLLKTIETTEDNGEGSFIELEYDSHNRRVREVKTSMLNGEIENILTVDFIYDENQRLKTRRYTYAKHYAPIDTDFEWHDGNITKTSFFFIDTNGRHFISSQTLLFDNKRNYTNQDIAFCYTGCSDEAVLSKNNLTGNPNTFSYNTSGYPVGYTYTNDNKQHSVQMNYE